MSAPAARDGAGFDAEAHDGVWLTDREPGELLGPRRVVVYVRDSEPIVIGELESRGEAVTLAEQVIEKIERAIGRGDWAELDERLVRPEAILSVDVERVE